MGVRTFSISISRSGYEKTAASAYDVLAPFVGFVQRVTFLIHENMRIAAVYQNLFDSDGHIKPILAELWKNSLEV